MNKSIISIAVALLLSSCSQDSYSENSASSQSGSNSSPKITVEIANAYIEGVRKACNLLFTISEDGYVYAGSERLSEATCQIDFIGTYDGVDVPFYEGYQDTVERIFLDTPYWCWGNECLTIEDF